MGALVYCLSWIWTVQAAVNGWKDGFPPSQTSICQLSDYMKFYFFECFCFEILFSLVGAPFKLAYIGCPWMNIEKIFVSCNLPFCLSPEPPPRSHLGTRTCLLVVARFQVLPARVALGRESVFREWCSIKSTRTTWRGSLCYHAKTLNVSKYLVTK